MVGAQPREVLEAAFERAATGARKLSVGPVTFGSVALLLALALWAVPARRRSA